MKITTSKTQKFQPFDINIQIETQKDLNLLECVLKTQDNKVTPTTRNMFNSILAALIPHGVK